MKKILFALLISAVLGLAITTSSRSTNVSACIQAPGCINLDIQPKGQITSIKQGFPAPYKTTVTFEPTNNNQHSPNYAGYAEAKTNLQSTNFLLAVINVVFWFPIVYFAVKLTAPYIKRRSLSKTHPTE